MRSALTSARVTGASLAWANANEGAATAAAANAAQINAFMMVASLKSVGNQLNGIAHHEQHPTLILTNQP
jgi:hypothetical protein